MCTHNPSISRDQRYLILISRIWRFELWDLADFLLKGADEESKSIPHEFPRSHWPKATGQCVKERYLSATMHNPYFEQKKKL